MTIDELKDRGLIIYECISGSRAYGLEVAGSDTDIKGVFILPQADIYGMNYVPQVSNESNDIVYYELGRLMELLKKNNPNILELLGTPEDKVLYRDELMDQLRPELFLSKRCKDTFGGYAFTQVRKARGLNKKIVNPVDKEKKTILEFCYVLHDKGAISLGQWLELKGFAQEGIGLVNVPHFQGVYAMYYDGEESLGYKGILRKEHTTSVLVSSVPKEESLVGYMHFNQDGFVQYCKDYKEYWSWVEKRNEHRYENNVAHGKNYDSKNMMHTFRLLDMAIEILRDGVIHVRRENREELLAIRRGEADYDDLIERANEKMKEVEAAYENSALPDEPNEQLIEDLLVEMRKSFYLREG